MRILAGIETIVRSIWWFLFVHYPKLSLRIARSSVAFFLRHNDENLDLKEGELLEKGEEAEKMKNNSHSDTGKEYLKTPSYKHWKTKDIRVYTAENALVFSSGACVTARGIITRNFRYRDPEKKTTHAYFIAKSRLDARECLFMDEVIHLFERFTLNNYYHWIIEVLPRYKLLCDFDSNVSRIPLVIPKESLNAFKESILVLNPNQLFIEIDANTCLRCRTVTMVDHTNISGSHHPKLLRSLSNRLIEGIKQTSSIQHKRIFISRQRASARKVYNIADLETVLSAYGFLTVELENYSFAEQVNLFIGAEVVLAPHGAGLTNIIFMKEGSNVIELSSEGLLKAGGRDCFEDIAITHNLRHQFVMCDSSKEHSLAPANNFIVNDNLQDALAKILG